jgi:hypothetical protein
MEADITVELTIVKARAPLRALADAMLRWDGEEITIRRCAVFQKPDQRPWASFPRLPIEKNGERRYVSLIELSRGLKQRVLDAILVEYRNSLDAR